MIIYFLKFDIQTFILHQTLDIKYFTFQYENCLGNFVRGLWFLKYWLNLFILRLIFHARDTRRPFGFDFIIVRNICAFQDYFWFDYIVLFLCRYKFLWTKDYVISWHWLLRQITLKMNTNAMDLCSCRNIGRTKVKAVYFGEWKSLKPGHHGKNTHTLQPFRKMFQRIYYMDGAANDELFISPLKIWKYDHNDQWPS